MLLSIEYLKLSMACRRISEFLFWCLRSFSRQLSTMNGPHKYKNKTPAHQIRNGTDKALSQSQASTRHQCCGQIPCERVGQRHCTVYRDLVGQKSTPQSKVASHEGPGRQILTAQRPNEQPASRLWSFRRTRSSFLTKIVVPARSSKSTWLVIGSSSYHQSNRATWY